MEVHTAARQQHRSTDVVSGWRLLVPVVIAALVVQHLAGPVLYGLSGVPYFLRFALTPVVVVGAWKACSTKWGILAPIMCMGAWAVAGAAVSANRLQSELVDSGLDTERSYVGVLLLAELLWALCLALVIYGAARRSGIALFLGAGTRAVFGVLTLIVHARRPSWMSTPDGHLALWGWIPLVLWAPLAITGLLMALERRRVQRTH